MFIFIQDVSNKYSFAKNAVASISCSCWCVSNFVIDYFISFMIHDNGYHCKFTVINTKRCGQGAGAYVKCMLRACRVCERGTLRWAHIIISFLCRTRASV